MLAGSCGRPRSTFQQHKARAVNSPVFRLDFRLKARLDRSRALSRDTDQGMALLARLAMNSRRGGFLKHPAATLADEGRNATGTGRGDESFSDRFWLVGRSGRPLE